LALIGLPLYVVEELAQMPAYRPESQSPLVNIGLCSLAAFGDVVILLVLWAVTAMVFRDAAWFSPPRFARYAGW
jgi:hypothetical protein